MNINYEGKIALKINLKSVPYFNDEIRQVFIESDKEEIAKGIEQDLINAIRRDFPPEEGTIKIYSISLDLYDEKNKIIHKNTFRVG